MRLIDDDHSLRDVSNAVSELEELRWRFQSVAEAMSRHRMSSRAVAVRALVA